LSGINSPTAPDLNPTISSDGRFIAFESNRGGAGGTDILMYDRLRAEFVQLGDANSPGREGEPAFTGDGARLAFVRDTLNARRIRLIDGASFKFIPLPGLDTVASYSDWAPAPNRDGSRIAFVSDRNGTADVFIWESDSSSRVLDLPELRSPDGDEVEPTLTPDGRFVCFASNRPGGVGGYDLYLYELQDLSHPVTIPLDSLNTSHDERNPSISADGMIISFESNRDRGLGKTDIWNHNRSDGRTGQARELSSTSEDIQPSLKWP
jgi:Tol biopolymer transport system component